MVYRGHNNFEIKTFDENNFIPAHWSFQSNITLNIPGSFCRLGLTINGVYYSSINCKGYKYLLNIRIIDKSYMIRKDIHNLFIENEQNRQIAKRKTIVNRVHNRTETNKLITTIIIIS